MAYIDLQKFRNEFEHLKNGVKIVRQICEERFTLEKSCEEVVKMAEDRINDLSEKLDDISNSDHRAKRATLNFVGNYAGDLFGVLDSRFAEKYSKDIAKLFGNEEHLLQLLKNHTSVVETTMNILKNDEAELERQNKQIEALGRRISEMSNHYEAASQFAVAMSHITMYMSEFEGNLRLFFRLFLILEEVV